MKETCYSQLYPLEHEQHKIQARISQFTQSLERFFIDGREKCGPKRWEVLKHRLLEICQGQRDQEVLQADWTDDDQDNDVSLSGGMEMDITNGSDSAGEKTRVDEDIHDGEWKGSMEGGGQDVGVDGMHERDTMNGRTEKDDKSILRGHAVEKGKRAAGEAEKQEKVDGTDGIISKQQRSKRGVAEGNLEGADTPPECEENVNGESSSEQLRSYVEDKKNNRAEENTDFEMTDNVTEDTVGSITSNPKRANRNCRKRKGAGKKPAENCENITSNDSVFTESYSSDAKCKGGGGQKSHRDTKPQALRGRPKTRAVQFRSSSTSHRVSKQGHHHDHLDESRTHIEPASEEQSDRETEMGDLDIELNKRGAQQKEQEPVSESQDLKSASPEFRMPSRIVKPKNFRFDVDKNGRLNNEGIGALSELCSTPVSLQSNRDTSGFPRTQLLSASTKKTRQVKLFTATDDIYSSTRKATLSRVPVSSSRKNPNSIVKKMSGTIKPIAQPNFSGALAMHSSVQSKPTAISQEDVYDISKTDESDKTQNQEIKAEEGNAVCGGTQNMVRNEAKATCSSKVEQGGKHRAVSQAESAADTKGVTKLTLTDRSDLHLRSSVTNTCKLRNAQGKELTNDLETTDNEVINDSSTPRKEMGHVKDKFRAEAPAVKMEAGLAEYSKPETTMYHSSMKFFDAQDGRAKEDVSLRLPRKRDSPVISTTEQTIPPSQMTGPRTAKKPRIGIKSAGKSAGKSAIRYHIERIRRTNTHPDEAEKSSEAADESKRIGNPQIAAGDEGFEPPEANEPVGLGLQRDIEGSEVHDAAVLHSASEDESLKNTSENKSLMSNLVTTLADFFPFKKKPSRESIEREEAARKKREREERRRRDEERKKAEQKRRRDKARELEERHRRAELNRKRMAEEEMMKKRERQVREDERQRKIKEEKEARNRRRLQAEQKNKEKHRRAEELRQKLAVATQSKRQTVLHSREGGESESTLKQSATGIRTSMDYSKGAVQQQARIMAPPPPKTPGSALKSKPFGISHILQPRHDAGPQNYEMSAPRYDDDESSDDDRYSSSRNKKLIPEWARRPRLIEALISQTQDPDKIFPKMHTCDLEEIFANMERKRTYRERTSSGVWLSDRLTWQEEIEYKKKAGYC